MKKLILLIALVAFAVTPAFAANTKIDSNSPATIGGSAFTPSTLVVVYATATASEYAAASGHKNGSKYYTTTSEGSTLGDGTKEVGVDVTTGEVPALPSATGT